MGTRSGLDVLEKSTITPVGIRNPDRPTRILAAHETTLLLQCDTAVQNTVENHQLRGLEDAIHLRTSLQALHPPCAFIYSNPYSRTNNKKGDTMHV